MVEPLTLPSSGGSLTIASLLRSMTEAIYEGMSRECPNARFDRSAAANLQDAPPAGELLCWASLLEGPIRGVVAVYTSMAEAASLSSALAGKAEPTPVLDAHDLDRLRRFGKSLAGGFERQIERLFGAGTTRVTPGYLQTLKVPKDHNPLAGTLGESRMVIASAQTRLPFAPVRFSLALPYSLLGQMLRAAGVDPEPELRRLTAPRSAVPRDPLRILVVEDSQPLRRILQHLLTLEGYESISAGTVQEAQTALNEQLIHVVLLDLALPDAPGLELLRSIRSDARLRFVPVIICSAHTTYKDVLTAIQIGADDYIAKPFSRSLLLDRIARAAANKASGHALRARRRAST